MLPEKEYMSRKIRGDRESQGAVQAGWRNRPWVVWRQGPSRQEMSVEPIQSMESQGHTCNGGHSLA